MTSILPPNSTGVERAIEGALKTMCDLAVPVADLWNPATCPETHLPWLAWALSVDDWDRAWPVEVKRQVIAASIEIHRHKGTRGGVLRALAAMGYGDAVLIEDLRTSTHGIFATNGASVHATSADCSGASVNGIRATRLATINARSANARRGASDQTTDFVVAEGGIIGAVGGTGGTSVTANATTVAGLIFK